MTKDSFTYRQRVYGKYASLFKGEAALFDRAWAQMFVRTYSHHLRGWFPAGKDARIVDLGCGSGRLLYLFKALGYSDIHGVDISPEQVALARQVVTDVVEGDIAEYLDGHVAAFDLITAIDLIEHLTKSEAARMLEKCFASLRPGGRLIIQTPNGDSPFVGAVRYGDFSHELCLTPRSLSYLLRLSGFEGVEPREQGPVRHGVVSTVRWCLWRLARLKLKAFNAIETGSGGSGILTRVFITSARKPDGPAPAVGGESP